VSNESTPCLCASLLHVAFSLLKKEDASLPAPPDGRHMAQIPALSEFLVSLPFFFLLYPFVPPPERQFPTFFLPSVVVVELSSQPTSPLTKMPHPIPNPQLSDRISEPDFSMPASGLSSPSR